MCRLSGPLTTFARTIWLLRLSQPLREENPIRLQGRYDFRAHYRVFWFPASGYGANWLGNGRFPVAGFWCDRGRFRVSTYYIGGYRSRLECLYEALQCPKNRSKNVGCVEVPRGVKTWLESPYKRARNARCVPGAERCYMLASSISRTQTATIAYSARPWPWHRLQAIDNKNGPRYRPWAAVVAQKTARQTPGRVLVVA